MQDIEKITKEELKRLKYMAMDKGMTNDLVAVLIEKEYKKQVNRVQVNNWLNALFFPRMDNYLVLKRTIEEY